MDSTSVRFIVEGNSFEVRRDMILPELEENQRKNLQEKVTLPAWVTPTIFALLQEYLKTKLMEVYNEHREDTSLLIQTLRLTDYLSMYRFQQKFISEVITPSICVSNCVAFLEQTHRKLRNQENGSQCWYSLLNASITFLAINIKEIYKIASDKLKKLHEKILNEILDRAIRNGNADEEMIIELIMESRRAGNMEGLCQMLRNNIENKKINPKIHAKLSWKLQDVGNIKEKRTKNFKFLDLDWMLEATRSKEDDLLVKLTFCGIEGRCEIGAFYMKVVWWVDGKLDEKREEKIHLNYILMNQKQQVSVLTITPEMQRQLGSSKIQLSIFCSLDQIYTFTLNYLAKNHEKVEIDERKLTPDELAIISVLLKHRKQYSSSIRFLKFLAYVRGGSLPQQYLTDYPYSQLAPYEIDFLQKMTVQKNPIDFNPSIESSEIRPFDNQSRRSQQRPQSRGRLRKIFASSPSRSVKNQPGPLKFEDIVRISNIKNYFYDKSNPFYHQL